ncbi:AAA family ATPase [archaeon]|jgi:archaeal cell division control protein 6|nr:AAA family ATPase [archaeon]MBT5491717.1 AAA family ATPase [bacterium]MBT4352862.1 AAA family ATPase [archaeon]MBT4648650.1 AAA family ATPase [archaeon]MBT6821828.1 AAA family ATPase [archaeon]
MPKLFKSMGVFNNILKDNESLFRDSVALDYDYIPKLIPYREYEQRYIANCIKPLFAKRNGKNVLVHGSPGIGKTVAIKHLFNELEEETDDIVPIYINCWQKNTSFKINLDICEQLGYKFTHNKKTDDLFDIIKDILNKKSAVFCFDEIDKVEDLSFLYMILEKIYRKTIILITNFKIWAVNLDTRLKSRLTLEDINFKKYNHTEIKGILKNRLQYAFVSNVWEDDAFNIAAKKTAEIEDIRSGLYILKESGNCAEEVSSKKITIEHVNKAIEKLSDFSIKDKTELKEDEQEILELIKENSEKKIGDLFELYKQKGGSGVYKTFQRKIEKLSKNKFISISKTQGGAEGNTTIVKYERETETKLNEY